MKKSEKNVFLKNRIKNGTFFETKKVKKNEKNKKIEKSGFCANIIFLKKYFLEKKSKKSEKIGF